MHQFLVNGSRARGRNQWPTFIEDKLKNAISLVFKATGWIPWFSKHNLQMIEKLLFLSFYRSSATFKQWGGKKV
jgi:hypothetical protein